MDNRLFSITLAIAGLSWATDSASIYGTWVRDPTKTRVTPPQQMEIKVTGQEFLQKSHFNPRGLTLRLDGTPVNGSPSMRRIDDRTLEETFYRNGEAYGTIRYTLSPDGEQLINLAEGKYPNGKPYSNTIVYRRIGGAAADGFNGIWQEDQAANKYRYPLTITFTRSGDDVKYEDGGGVLEYTAPLDGKDHPTKGQSGSGQSVALEQLSNTSMRITLKQNGKTTRTSTYEVSADNRTLTVTTASESGGTSMHSVDVYTRQ